MLVMVLVFGMTIAGCNNGSTDVDREEEFTFPSTSGEFTFTDIPSEYNGKFVYLGGLSSNDSTRIMIGLKNATTKTSISKYFSTMTGVKIEDETIKIPLYTYLPSSPVSTIQAYTGNDTAYIEILIYDTEIIHAENVNDYTAVAIFGTSYFNTPTTFPVQFSNGTATKSNNDATKILE